MRHTVHTLVRIGAAVILKPERRDILLDQFDLLQSEIARLHELETRFEDAQKRDELERVHESISNITAVIRMDLVNLLSSMDALELGDESVQLVLAILKSRRLRPMPLERTPQIATNHPI
jgi:hypothetical protein